MSTDLYMIEAVTNDALNVAHREIRRVFERHLWPVRVATSVRSARNGSPFRLLPAGLVQARILDRVMSELMMSVRDGARVVELALGAFVAGHPLVMRPHPLVLGPHSLINQPLVIGEGPKMPQWAKLPPRLEVHAGADAVLPVGFFHAEFGSNFGSDSGSGSGSGFSLSSFYGLTHASASGSGSGSGSANGTFSLVLGRGGNKSEIVLMGAGTRATNETLEMARLDAVPDFYDGDKMFEDAREDRSAWFSEQRKQYMSEGRNSGGLDPGFDMGGAFSGGALTHDTLWVNYHVHPSDYRVDMATGDFAEFDPRAVSVERVQQFFGARARSLLSKGRTYGERGMMRGSEVLEIVTKAIARTLTHYEDLYGEMAGWLDDSVDEMVARELPDPEKWVLSEADDELVSAEAACEATGETVTRRTFILNHTDYGAEELMFPFFEVVMSSRSLGYSWAGVGDDADSVYDFVLTGGEMETRLKPALESRLRRAVREAKSDYAVHLAAVAAELH